MDAKLVYLQDSDRAIVPGRCDSQGRPIVRPGDGEKIIGYNDVISEQFRDTNLSSGFVSVNGTSVPSGEVWVGTVATIMYSGTSPTYVDIITRIDGTGVRVLREYAPNSGQWYLVIINSILGEGDKFMLVVNGATAGDACTVRWSGYKFSAP